MTGAQADAIEKRWSQKALYSRVVRTDRPGFAEEREILALKFGGPPRDTDVLWSLLNKDRLRYANEQNWGLYRNSTLEMGDVLRVESRPKDAARFYLEVCYLDLNNPTNYGSFSNPELLKQYPRWSPDPNGLAPGVLVLIGTVVDEADLSIETLHDIFMGEAKRDHRSLDLPMSPEDGWKILREKLVTPP